MSTQETAPRSANGTPFQKVVGTETSTTAEVNASAAPAAPFAEHALGYRQAGWPVLPLAPGSKGPPPDGYTGRTGVDASEPDVWAWTEDRPHANIALRMPAGVLGIDVDHYGDKHGADTLGDLVAECGPLPPAPWSSARDDGASGIRYFRVPDGYQSIGRLAGIEFIQRHHRYAVAPPSVHPEGTVYRWHAADGAELDTVPRVDELPELPQAWLSRLADEHPGDTAKKTSLSDPEADAAFERLATPGEPCRCAREALGAILGELHGGSSRHDTMCTGQVRLLRLGEQGHPGIGAAVQTLRNAFRDAIGDDRAAVDKEWSRGRVGAIELITSRPQPGKGCLDGTALELVNTSETDPGGEQNVGPASVELTDLLARPVPEYDWLVPGLLERQDRVLITGEEGGGKSTLLRQLAVQLASGIHPFGGALFDPLRVLLLDVENSPRQITREIRPLAVKASEQYVPGQLHVLVRTEGLDLTHYADAAWLLAEIEHVRPDIIIGGPVYKIAGGDPNSEETARAVAQRLDRIRADYGCALILETHSPHASNGAKRPIRPYGASLWLRWPEFGLFLDGLGDGDLRDWRGPRDERDWPFRLQRGGGWPWTVVTRDRDRLWSRITDACLRHGGQPSIRKLADHLGTSRSTVQRAIEEHRADWEAMQ